MDLRVVKTDLALHWPDRLGKPTLRGLAGYCVDLNAPCELDWCGGMLQVLEPAPKGATPTPITHPAALREIEALKNKPPEKPAPAKPAVGGDMPPVDLPPKKAAAAR